MWTVQYNSPYPLENQRISPTQILNNEQYNPDHVTMQAIKDMKYQLEYIDMWLDKVQELMKELQLVPGTTPKGKEIKRNQILSEKQLWVVQQTDEIDQAPMICVSSVRDINHTSPKTSPHLNLCGQRPDESNW